MRTELFILTTLILTSPLAAAGNDRPMTIGDLQQLCSASDIGSKNACRFFIFGVALGVQLGAGQAGNNKIVCIPENVSAAAMELAVKLKMAEDLVVFPQDRDLDASGFIGAVVLKLYACSKSH